jgi:long-subunit fatty acid transport protein
MRKWPILWLTLLPFTGKGQYSNLGSWNILNVKYRVNDKFSLFGEAQLRSLSFYDEFHYYEFKGGLNFKAQKNLTLTLGSGSYQTFREGGNFVKPKNNDEFRIWPQVTLQQSLGPLRIEQRYRAEFRFTSNGYRNRFRYRLGLAFPFGKEKDQQKPFQLIASNELFFTDREPYFERNRAALGFNYSLTKSTQLFVGYLHQFDYRINDETGRDFLQLGYFIEMAGKKNKRQVSHAILNEH